MMTEDADTSEAINPDPDPDGTRSLQLHAISTMLVLTTRLDLPVVKWAVEPYPNYERDGRKKQFPTLHGHIWGQAAQPRAALNVWAEAFDVEIVEEPHEAKIHAYARFTFRDVPVEIVTVFDLDDPR